MCRCSRCCSRKHMQIPFLCLACGSSALCELRTACDGLPAIAWQCSPRRPYIPDGVCSCGCDRCLMTRQAATGICLHGQCRFRGIHLDIGIAARKGLARTG